MTFFFLCTLGTNLSLHETECSELTLRFLCVRMYVFYPTVKERATKSLQAHWKTVAPDLEVTPTWSVSQEKLAYIPPAVRYQLVLDKFCI